MAFDLSQLGPIAQQYGLDPSFFTGVARIESGGDPSEGVGGSSPYQGLFQLSSDEFAKGGGSDIGDGLQNAKAAALNLAQEKQQLTAQLGRPPTDTELYMAHQQGVAGTMAHLGNPGGIAWQNIRKYYPDDATAKSAVWGNVPDDVKAKFPGGVDSLTSGDFLNLWGSKVADFTGAKGATGPHWAPGGGAASGAAPAAAPSNALAAAASPTSPTGLLNALQPTPQASVIQPAVPITDSGGSATPNLLASQIRPAPLLNPNSLLALRQRALST